MREGSRWREVRQTPDAAEAHPFARRNSHPEPLWRYPAAQGIRPCEHAGMVRYPPLEFVGSPHLFTVTDPTRALSAPCRAVDKRIVISSVDCGPPGPLSPTCCVRQGGCGSPVTATNTDRPAMPSASHGTTAR